MKDVSLGLPNGRNDSDYSLLQPWRKLYLVKFISRLYVLIRFGYISALTFNLSSRYHLLASLIQDSIIEMSELRRARRSKPIAPGHRPGRTSRTKQPSPIIPDVKGENGADNRKLLFSMDYGTKTLSLAYRIAKVDEEPSPNTVRLLQSRNTDAVFTTTALWPKFVPNSRNTAN